MARPPLRDRLRYAFDNSMARGPIALIFWLAVISFIVIALAAALLHFGRITQDNGEVLSFGEAFWESLVRTLDSGTFGGDTGWKFRLVMLGVTIGGVLFVSALIGIINNGLERKMDQLRRGRSIVLERNHTLILGWSPKIFTIISELAIANENQPKPRLVILADKDVADMQDEVEAKVGGTGRTRIIYRTGNPLDLADLAVVNPHAARAIIVLAPESGDPDSEVIKTILALTNNPHRPAGRYHIVAELSEPRNLEVARLVGKDEVQIIVTTDLISRIIVQTARQSGLSVVYTELLDFGGDEIYFTAEPALVGRTFGEALLAYEDSAVIGLRTVVGVQLNPPMSTLIQPGDQIIAISEDDDTIRLSGLITDWSQVETQLQIDAGLIRAGQPASTGSEHTLLLGWNHRGPLIVNELDDYALPGARLTIAADVPDLAAIIERECGEVRRLSIETRTADTTDRRALDALNLPAYTQIIILCYSDQLPPQAADARTLITLLHLRDIKEKQQLTFRIVSEVLDVRNRELAEVTRADDFIISNKLTSLMLSQVAENRELMAVFEDLFDPSGSEIYLKPAPDYVAAGQPVNFYTVVEAARQRGEVAIGYRQLALADRADRSYGVVVNPDKSEHVTFEPVDRIIVLAKEERHSL